MKIDKTSGLNNMIHAVQFELHNTKDSKIVKQLHRQLKRLKKEQYNNYCSMEN